MAYGDASFSKQVFNISVTEIESIVDPNRVTNDRRWKSVALVRIHSPSLPKLPINLAVPWRALDHEGEVLESFVTKKRDRKAALNFLRRAMKRYGRPEVVVTDRFRSYQAAMREIGNEARQEAGRWLNNQVENSHQPFRRRERAMAKFRRAKSLQKFATVHASIYNHFNQERHFCSRENFKLNRAAALAEWRQLAA